MICGECFDSPSSAAAAPASPLASAGSREGKANNFSALLPRHRKLKRLNLGGNQLTSVPQHALSIFDNLKKLEIQENKIRVIKEGDFEGKAVPMAGAIDSLLIAFIRFRRNEGTGLAHSGPQPAQQGAGERVQPLAAAELARAGGQPDNVHRQGRVCRARG